MKIVFWTKLLLVMGALVVLVAGCGQDAATTAGEEGERPQALREVRISLNEYIGPEQAALVMAEANGYFTDVGIEVILDPPASPAWPIRYLLSKIVDSDFSISYEPQVAIAHENGKPIVAVGALVSQPTAAMIWLKGSGIDRIADLRGKAIAIPGLPFQVEFLRHVLARGGLGLEDVKVKYAGYKGASFIVSGRADALFGGSAQQEGIELRAHGLNPVITPVRSLGVPGYDELVLVTSTELVAKEPQLIHDFLAAVSRGAAAAVRNPEAVVREIETHVEPSHVASRKVRAAQVRALLPLLSRTGYMDPRRAKALVGWMADERMLDRPLPVSDWLNNGFLALP